MKTSCLSVDKSLGFNLIKKYIAQIILVSTNTKTANKSVLSLIILLINSFILNSLFYINVTGAVDRV